MDINTSEVDMEEIKAQCEHNWRKLKSVQSELQSLPPFPLQNITETGAVGGEIDGNCSLELLKWHEKRLKAELLLLEENGPSTLPENKEIQRLVLEQNQLKSSEQLEEVLVFFRAKRSEVIDELKREEETSSELQRVNETLKKKLSSCSVETSGESVPSPSHMQDISAKLSKINTKHKFFRNELKQILNQHFPAPQHRTAAATLNESRDIDVSNMLPLSSVIGKLIEQSLNTPAQPYIDIDETIWPYHVELLLRFQIALKDPQNSKRMKLTPFHL
ncbi:centromere protein K [Biomphalaria glabrata]|nr:centromere protein K [Biomphalaria glabrata]